MKPFLLIACLSFFISPTWETDPLHWGIGILVAVEEGDKPLPEFGLVLPPGIGLPCYNAPEGKPLGFLYYPANWESGGNSYHLYFQDYAGKRRSIGMKDFIETGYELKNLVVHKREGDWIQVLHHSVGSHTWMHLATLERLGYQFQDWKTFMLQTPQAYHPPETFALNLRTGPGTEHERLASLRLARFEIRLTGQTEGLWAEVKVIEYTVHPCYDGKPTGQEWTGWLKLLDDEGFPNIWYYTRGC